MPYSGEWAPIEWRDVVGSRMLIREYNRRLTMEVVLVEVSPSGKMIKLRYRTGAEMWLEAADHQIVEVLPAGRAAS